MDIDVDIPFPNEISNDQPKRALEAAAARFKGLRLCRRPLKKLIGPFVWGNSSVLIMFVSEQVCVHV